MAETGIMANLSVLLIEDNLDDEFLAVWVLQRVGIERITVARDGREALDLLVGTGDAPPVLPDLVILDLRLPKIDGWEVLRRIRAAATTASLPVLVLSSSEDSGDHEMCHRLGSVDFFAKPLKAATLRGVLARLGQG